MIDEKYRNLPILHKTDYIKIIDYLEKNIINI